MSKKLNYVMIVEGLTGDSQVLFYKSPELAERAFNNLTQPLIKVCEDNGCDVEDETVYYPLKDGKAWRFNTGELEALDELLNECNRYIEWNSIEVADNVDHYVADLSEWVDDSTITFYTKDEAIKHYNDVIDDTIATANEHLPEKSQINRYDQSTWESKDKGTLFSEPIDTSKNYGEAFFGYSIDMYFTIRCGIIEEMDDMKYHVIASGGYLKRPEIYKFNIDPTDPDTINELSGFKTFQELVDYYLEEEEAEWGQKFCKCNIIPESQMNDIIKQSEEEGQ